MRTIKLTGGDLGGEMVKVRANLARPETSVEVDYCEGSGWQGCQYQSAQAQTVDGLIEIGKELAAAAVEVPISQFDCESSEI